MDYNLQPDLKIRNPTFMKDTRRRNGVDILKNYFSLLVYSVIASPNCSATKVKEATLSLISNHVVNKKMNWVDCYDKDEDFDVTFTVPILDGQAIRISYRL